MTGVFLNVDAVAFFKSVPEDKISGEAVDMYVDDYTAAGVSCLLCNTNAQKTNYNSAVWEPFWHGYGRRELKEIRPDFLSMLTLSEQGVDYPARFIARCRHRKIAPWISLRMNDVHDVRKPDHPLHSSFWKEHPQFWRVPYRARASRFGARQERALDYSYLEVRQHYRALIEETLERYDIDGLELDFMRHECYFGIGRELAGGRLLAEWLREIRRLAETAANQLGHKIQLGVRVPSRPETSRNLGLDAVAWAKHGLVDLVVVTPDAGAQTAEFNMPMQFWKRLLAPYGVTLAGCLIPTYKPFPTVNYESFPYTPELAIGAAVAVLSGGADVVYLYNHFFDRWSGKMSGRWTRKPFEKTVRAMASLDKLLKLPRRHIVTYREILAPGELCPFPQILHPSESDYVERVLPVSGTLLMFRLQTGFKPSGREVQAILGFEVEKDEKLVPPLVRVNGVRCSTYMKVRKEYTRMKEKVPYVLLTYNVPEKALAQEAHVIEVSTANPYRGSNDKPLKIMWVEFSII